jgi:hypothetical protein
MSYLPLSGDADSGINPALTYTAKADFFGSGTHIVNGVSFVDTGFTGTGYTLTGPTNTLVGGNPNFVTGEVGAMVNDFNYGPADGNATLSLSGLTIGAQYVTTWYNRGWGAPGGRVVFMTASDTPGGFYRIDQNFTGDGNGNVIRYAFTANATTQTFAIDAAVNGDSFHHYAFSNAIRNDAIFPLAAAPVAPRISFQSGAAPQTPPGVLNNDLLQTQLASFNTTGSFDPEGTGGLGALVDGSFTSSVGGFSQFLTPNPGATITYDLNITTNTFGYDISSIRGFGGWQDGGRDRQNYSLFYSLVGSSTFNLLGTVDYDAPPPTGASAITSIFDTALKNVDSIRIEFLSPQENGHAGYGELDVVGTASVPEPSSALLLLSAAPWLLRRRRA